MVTDLHTFLFIFLPQELQLSIHFYGLKTTYHCFPSAGGCMCSTPESSAYFMKEQVGKFSSIRGCSQFYFVFHWASIFFCHFWLELCFKSSTVTKFSFVLSNLHHSREKKYPSVCSTLNLGLV